MIATPLSITNEFVDNIDGCTCSSLLKVLLYILSSMRTVGRARNLQSQEKLRVQACKSFMFQT